MANSRERAITGTFMVMAPAFWNWSVSRTFSPPRSGFFRFSTVICGSGFALFTRTFGGREIVVEVRAVSANCGSMEMPLSWSAVALSFTMVR